jgi:hypothetical protein
MTQDLPDPNRHIRRLGSDPTCPHASNPAYRQRYGDCGLARRVARRGGSAVSVSSFANGALGEQRTRTHPSIASYWRCSCATTLLSASSQSIGPARGLRRWPLFELAQLPSRQLDVDRGLLHRLLARISDAAFVRRRVVMTAAEAVKSTQHSGGRSALNFRQRSAPKPTK